MYRIATIDDADKIDKIRKQTRDYHIKYMPNVFKTYNLKDKEYTKNFIQNENTDILFWEENSQIIGYMLVEKKIKPETDCCYEKKFLHIEDFGVDAEFRNSGIGTKLFQQCKNYAKEKGFKKIKLEVHGFNSNAFNFYIKNGFEIEKNCLEYND